MMAVGTAWPPVSVVIRTLNVADWIAGTLDALFGQDYPGPMEVLIVDSGSTDEGLQIASGYNVRILHLSGEYRPGRSLNWGDRESRYSVIVHLSADASPAHDGYLRALVAPFRDPDVVATFGRDLPRPWASPSQARDLETWFPPDPNLDPARRFSNANAAVRKEIVRRFPFDESLHSTEDLEWARRVLGIGYRIVYVPEATTFHTHDRRLRQVFRRAYRQRDALRVISPREARFSFWRAFRFWVGLGLLDIVYAIRRNYPVKEWLHPLAFRAAQAWGLYLGARKGAGVEAQRERSAALLEDK